MRRSRRLVSAAACALFALLAGLTGCTAGTTTDGVAARGAVASRSGTQSADAAEPGTRRACSVPSSLAGQDVARLPVTGKVIALTFDAGANADGLPSIRSTLREKKVRATFFLTGSFVKNFPVRSKRIATRDLVGNHTMTHPDLTSLPDDKVTRQVRTAETTITSSTGEDPRRFFRFPYGAGSAHLVGLLNSLCYVPFRWTVDSLGWKGTSGGQTVAKVVARVVGAAEPGAIVLMHVGSNPDDGTTLDAAALPQVITKLRARDYRFVRLSWVMSPDP